MKATDLNQALNYVDDAYLMEADTPEKEIITMKTKKRMLRILAAAAMISLLTITAYAADLLNIRSLVTGSSKWYTTYASIGRAKAKAGLDVNVPQQFENGFQFQRAEVQEVKCEDENGKVVMTFQELNVHYHSDLGQKLILCVNPELEEISVTESIPAARRTYGNTDMYYYLDHYKFVPEDHKLSREEEAWANQPGNYISYGSDQIEEKTVAFLCWTVDGINYYFMDDNAEVNPDTLFSMAQEVMKE